jgi:hypothetical protein
MRTRLSNAAPMKPGSWTGTVTQEMVVQGTATSGMEVDATGRSTGERPVAGNVRKGSAKLPVIDLT